MATLPAATILGRVDVSNGAGDESSPAVAINPSNPQNLASVWVRNDPGRPGNNKVIVEGAVSTNGGASWSSFPATPGPVLRDPTITDSFQQFPRVTDAGVAFDRAGNLYVLQVQHTVSNNAGAVVLSRFTAAGVPQDTQVVHAWNRAATNQSRAKAVLQPVLAVDDTQAFTDPAGGTQPGPFAGRVYIAWVGRHAAARPGPRGLHPLTIELVSSTDRGATFNADAPLPDQGRQLGQPGVRLAPDRHQPGAGPTAPARRPAR
jgi:hypothetical protein